MPSHFSDIGFQFTEENFYDELIQTLEALMKESSHEITVGDNSYIVLYLDQDIEFWIPCKKNQKCDISYFELHFNTHHWNEVINPSWVSKDFYDMQGIISLWNSNKSFPLNVTIPNALCVPKFHKEKIYKAQIACFAEEIDVYKSEDDFHKEHQSFETQAFIPIGQFSQVNSEEAKSSIAWLSGIVKEVNRRTNSYTKNDYYHIIVESYDMDFDVLVDATYIEKIEIGDIVSVTAWLSGKLEIIS